MSLDVFRGATIAAMMLVNNPRKWSGVYQPLLHAEWHGWTFTDLIFPFFLWIVGVAIPISTARRLEQGQSRMQLFRHALRRAVILFALARDQGCECQRCAGAIENSPLRTAVRAVRQPRDGPLL